MTDAKIFTRARYDKYVADSRSATLTASDSKHRNETTVVIEQNLRYAARRLTPLERERLQGYPDGWTDIGAWTDSKGIKRPQSSDTKRYEAVGNSIALPSWTWLLQRLSAYCGERPTMASLFDGIGGFPLIWERINGKGACQWASEIDEFCIAVTKARFPNDE